MSIDKQIKLIDNNIKNVKNDYENLKKETDKIMNKYIMELWFAKADLIYQDYKLNRLVNFCNTGKFED